MIGRCQICGKETKYDLCYACKTPWYKPRYHLFPHIIGCLPVNWERELKDLVSYDVAVHTTNEVVEWDHKPRNLIKYEDMGRGHRRADARNRVALEYDRRSRLLREAGERLKNRLRKSAINSGRESSSKETSTPANHAIDPVIIRTIYSVGSTLVRDTNSTTGLRSVGRVIRTRLIQNMSNSAILLSRFEGEKPLNDLKFLPTSVENPTSSSPESSSKKRWSKSEVRTMLEELYGKSGEKKSKE